MIILASFGHTTLSYSIKEKESEEIHEIVSVNTYHYDTSSPLKLKGFSTSFSRKIIVKPETVGLLT